MNSHVIGLLPIICVILLCFIWYLVDNRNEFIDKTKQSIFPQKMHNFCYTLTTLWESKMRNHCHYNAWWSFSNNSKLFPNGLRRIIQWKSCCTDEYDAKAFLVRSPLLRLVDVIRSFKLCISDIHNWYIMTTIAISAFQTFRNVSASEQMNQNVNLFELWTIVVIKYIFSLCRTSLLIFSSVWRVLWGLWQNCSENPF